VLADRLLDRVSRRLLDDRLGDLADDLVETVQRRELVGLLSPFEFVTHPVAEEVDQRDRPVRERLGSGLHLVEAERPVRLAVDQHRRPQVRGDSPVGVPGAIGQLRRVRFHVVEDERLTRRDRALAVGRSEWDRVSLLNVSVRGRFDRLEDVLPGPLVHARQRPVVRVDRVADDRR
jgi:hypothetical protein